MMTGFTYIPVARTAVLPVTLLALLCAEPAVAAERTVPVKFKPGTSSSIVTGSVKGYDTVNYTLDARGGQTMTAVFAPSGGSSCYFNILQPDGSAIFNGSMDGNTFSGSLPASGSYKVQAYLMRNDARRGVTCSYSLTIGING